MYNLDTDERHVQAVSSGPRRYVCQVKISTTLSAINTDKAEPGFDANNYINTRSDTICASTKWRLLSDSGQCCDVYGFHNKFKFTEDVPIARVPTGICN